MIAAGRSGDVHRFLIIRLGSLGDVVHGIPASAALRRQFPHSRIDWLVDPRYVELLNLVDGLDRAIPFDPRELTRNGKSWAVVRELRRTRYDAVLDFQGLLKSAMLARFAKARRAIGFSRGHLREPVAALFYTTTVDPGSASHVIEQAMSLLRPLGVTDRTARFPIAIPRSAVADVVAQRYGLDRYVLINPGAAWPNKRWPAQSFGRVASAILHEHGLRSVVLWGPGEESLAATVAASSEGAAEAAPASSISDMVALASGARAMVSGDTGPLHVAGAVGTPLVALFGPTYPERNGPWSPHDIVVSRVASCACLYERRCRRDSRCIDDIAVSEVVRAVTERLGVHG